MLRTESQAEQHLGKTGKIFVGISPSYHLLERQHGHYDLSHPLSKNYL